MTRSIATHLASAGFLGLSMAAAFAAEPATVAWTTFLYDAPSFEARAIDEPPHGAAVTLGTCANGWCEATVGRAGGYLREEVLARGASPAPLAGPSAAVAAPAGPCFVAPQAGIASPPAPTRFCAN